MPNSEQIIRSKLEDIILDTSCFDIFGGVGRKHDKATAVGYHSLLPVNPSLRDVEPFLLRLGAVQSRGMRLCRYREG
jgi:hypothetical protein